MSKLSNYSRVKKLGQGGFGQIYLVFDNRDSHHYVQKEIDLSKLDKQAKLEALKEVQFLKQLNHPNIIEYKDYFEEKNFLYIIMQYADNGDLEQKVKEQAKFNNRSFSEEQVIDWFVQLCLAMKHIHDRKILHRDLKTQNIFLMKNLTVKLGDFGIAKSLNSTMEQAKTQIGTPYYLSPEICSEKPYNNKSDIWALGIILYELMCLKHPFTGNSMKQLLTRIITAQYNPIPQHLYSKQLRNLVDLMLQKEPKKRPTINQILGFPFIQTEIGRFLNQNKIQEEFSHTVIHSKPKISVPKTIVSNNNQIALQQQQQQQLLKEQQAAAQLAKKKQQEAELARLKQERARIEALAREQEQKRQLQLQQQAKLQAERIAEERKNLLIRQQQQLAAAKQIEEQRRLHFKQIREEAKRNAERAAERENNSIHVAIPVKKPILMKQNSNESNNNANKLQANPQKVSGNPNSASKSKAQPLNNRPAWVDIVEVNSNKNRENNISMANEDSDNERTIIRPVQLPAQSTKSKPPVVKDNISVSKPPESNRNNPPKSSSNTDSDKDPSKPTVDRTQARKAHEAALAQARAEYWKERKQAELRNKQNNNGNSSNYNENVNISVAVPRKGRPSGIPRDDASSVVPPNDKTNNPEPILTRKASSKSIEPESTTAMTDIDNSNISAEDRRKQRAAAKLADMQAKEAELAKARAEYYLERKQAEARNKLKTNVVSAENPLSQSDKKEVSSIPSSDSVIEAECIAEKLAAQIESVILETKSVTETKEEEEATSTTERHETETVVPQLATIDEETKLESELESEQKSAEEYINMMNSLRSLQKLDNLPAEDDDAAPIDLATALENDTKEEKVNELQEEFEASQEFLEFASQSAELYNEEMTPKIHHDLSPEIITTSENQSASINNNIITNIKDGDIPATANTTSNSNSSSDGIKQFDGVSSSEATDLAYRTETLRTFLDQRLGEDLLLEVYHALRDAENNNNCQDLTVEKIKSIVSPLLSNSQLKYVSLLQQLLECEKKMYG